MNTTKALGDRGEAAAAQYLRKRGCQLLASQGRWRLFCWCMSWPGTETAPSALWK